MSTPTTTEAPGATGGLTGTIRLWSKYLELRMLLVPDQFEYVEGRGRVLTKKGVKVHFRGGFADIDASILDLVVAHPVFAGETQPKAVWFADDEEAALLAARLGHNTQVVTGPIGSHRPTLEKPPTVGWDKVAPEEIRKLIETGHVPDLEGAMRYELNHRANSLVVAYLAAAISGLPAKAGEEIHQPEQEGAPVDPFDGGFQRPTAPDGAETAFPAEIPQGQEVV